MVNRLPLVDEAQRVWVGGESPDRLFAALFDTDVAGVDWKHQVGELAHEVFGETIYRDLDAFEAMFNAVTDATWKARERCLGEHNEEWLRMLPEWAGKSRTAEFALILIELQLHRFNFDHDGIRRVLDMANDAPLRFHNLSVTVNLNQVFLTFARLLSGRRIDPQHVFDAVGVTQKDRTASQLESVPLKIKHLMLHGLWLYPNTEYGEQILAFSEAILRYHSPNDVIAHYRRAEGYRRMAAIEAAPRSDVFSGHTVRSRDDFYAEALHSVQMAIKNLSPGETVLHGEFVSYRMMIATERQVQNSIRDRVDAELAHVAAEVERMSEKIEAESRNSLLRSIEILSVFLAVIGVLSFNISLAGLEQVGTLERFGLILTAGVILGAFSWLVHVAVYRHTHAEPAVVKTRRKQIRQLQQRIAALEERTNIGCDG